MRKFGQPGAQLTESRLVMRGKAQMLITVLCARFGEVPAHVRNRITECADSERLDAWGRRAVDARELDAVFG
ncbi:hypothetical protein [Stackebrandtia soli]|uniref:hypothetical protein n=1 Tax=Stackebrandtia soli TaxID=1892856 RepID=UPI0039E9449C